MSVIIETTKGDITVDLYVKERPRSCLNFLKLCKLKYYNECKFNKIEKDFIAQSGDPTNTGNGGDSIFYHMYGENARFFEYELKPNLSHEKIGTLSMINNGENLHGSQFFLTLSANLEYLDKVHTVFGYVVDGLDVLFKLNDVLCDEKFRPYLDIYITHTVVLDDPFEDPKYIEFPISSPEVTENILNNDAFDFGENYDENEKTKSIAEIEEEIKEKEAKARAYILEMIGDIPDADVKPPDNVLFVCKLNSITKDEDLEVIFSRFGKILSCEVIKDQKTGESLQYAFIEFEKPEDCEKAYFKMDNVLIDDRRIHVDFSQSVSRIKWHGKGKGVTVTESDNGNHRDRQYDKNELRRYRNEHDRYDRRYPKDRPQTKSSSFNSHYRRTRSRSPNKNKYASSSTASSSKFYKSTRRRSRSKSPYYHERDHHYRSHHHQQQQHHYRRSDERSSSSSNSKHERSRDYDTHSSRSSSSRHHHQYHYHRDNHRH